jgi:hypothetical protein
MLTLLFICSLAVAAPNPNTIPPATGLDAKAQVALVDQLVAKYTKLNRRRAQMGVAQVSRLWRPSDGDTTALTNFINEHFIGDLKVLELTFLRLERAMEQVDGHMLEIGRELRAPTELDLPAFAKETPVDAALAGFDASAHIVDDWFANKLAFVVLLNFPQLTLAEKIASETKLSRRDWAMARLTARFSRRVPADVVSKIAQVQSEADAYIASYNIWMHHVVDDKGQRLFPSGKRLISHWNLRDELKAQYGAGPEGVARQRMIVAIMERIVTQTIPAIVINNPAVDWNPFTNVVVWAPQATIEKDAPARQLDRKVAPSAQREDDVRYQKWLTQFAALQAADAFSPSTPTAIARSFELERQLPEERLRALLVEVLSSPLVPKVAAEIERRLGRPLERQDLWYDGFKARASMNEAELDAITRRKYPTPAAFQADLKNILLGLQFTPAKATYLADRIIVDPARGAGHALQAARKGDFPHLRTRIEKDGMNYKGYNIAIHELGHNVEQVFSLYDIDSSLLQGVPNNAFTEALAFVFQARDLQLLGLQPASKDSKSEAVLADFWATWEIAGVGLVDMDAWHWLYDHKTATAAEFRAAVVDIAAKVWAKYYQPVLGGLASKQPSPLLAIYSHMVAYPLYVSDYPLGHLIAFQIEEQVEQALSKGGSLGAEFERMAKVGAVTPDAWMRAATGKPVEAGPLLRATDRALAKK